MMFNKYNVFRDKYPLAILFVVASIFFEKFYSSGMITILTLYLVDILKFSETDATLIYHVYTMLGSFFPVIGGIIADSYLGRYKTILYLTVVYVAGAVVLTTASTPFFGHVDKRIFSIVGFVAIVIGSGCSSPCTLPFGGDQFVTPRHVRQLPMFFSLSYFAVNASALISMYVTPILRHNFQCFGEENCFPLAFGVLTFALIMSLIAFWSGKSQYIRQEPQGNIIVDVSKCIIHALKSKLRSKETRDHWLDHADDKFSKSLISDTKAAFQVLFLFLPMPVFWALYDQQGSSWKFQATRMNGSLGWFTIKPDQMQDINPLLIMVFIPLLLADSSYFPGLQLEVHPYERFSRLVHHQARSDAGHQPPADHGGFSWKFQATRMNGSLGWFTIKPDQMQDTNPLLIMGFSWKFQATRMNGSLGWFTIKPDQMQDTNPLLIMGFSWKFQATRMNGSLGWFTIKPDQMQDTNPLLIMGFSWKFQATRMNGSLGWFTIKPDQMQDINPLLIMVFIPLLLADSSYFPGLQVEVHPYERFSRAPAGSSKPPGSSWKFQATRMNGSLGWFTIKPDQMQDINPLLIMGSSWKFQATRMNGSLGWFTIKPDQMQDINPLLIMVFIPLFDIVIYPWLAKYRLLERPLQRFTVGGLLAAVAFAMSAVLECNLETTYPVLPSPGLAQLRIFNGLECDVAFTLPMDPRSGVIPALDALQLTSIPLEGEAEYELRFMTAANCSEFRNRRFHGRVVLQEAKAKSVFLHTIKGVPVVSTVNETDEIDKTDLENPRLRVLHSLRPFQSEFWLSQHKYHEMFEFEKDTFSTPYKSVVETGSFTAMLANRTVYGDIKLGPAGIYTLILHSHNNFTIGHVIEVTPPNSVHMLWQLPQYITITVAEIMFSVTGNEFAYTQAPDSMKSVISASWAMTDAVGNFIVVIIAHAQLFDSHATEFFLYSIIMVLAMVLFMLISCQYQYYDPIKETPPTISATIPPPSITPTS
ncbi:peptide transporter family 1-like [Macrosteles quadrilineatus]|uniref:peptide transporter family 1-like n=1 Tax=Macrosteles quadrilineatus TaxID=74068 RepID=UPI0023E2B57E|nr:peptide transporter family 1-like [Macrosteles quadrilineatus]